MHCDCVVYTFSKPFKLIKTIVSFAHKLLDKIPICFLFIKHCDDSLIFFLVDQRLQFCDSEIKRGRVVELLT
jgi:hypothetical protein